MPEMETESPLALPTLRRTVVLFARALVLRCPNCGGWPVLEHWFKLRVRCPRCGLRLERGEADYFTGAMLLNIVIAEGLLAVVLIAVLLATWPDVPWNVLQWAAPPALGLAPVLFLPFSKTTWLAFDLLLRPVTAAEMEWHRGSEGAPAGKAGEGG